jgi:hypothetical protein
MLEITRQWRWRLIRVCAAAARITAATTLAASAMLVPAASAHGSGGPSYHPAPAAQRFGVNAQVMFWGMPQLNWNEQVAEMGSDGIETVRADAAWSSVQPTAEDGSRGIYDWGYLDRIETALAEKRLRWLPVVDYSTPWDASSEFKGTPDPYSAPRDDQGFARFAAALVARYGSHGSFWTAHPQLPAEPVAAVEVWNEENTSLFWNPAPDAQAYLGLYEATRRAIHAVSDGVEVLVGGLSNPAAPFLEQLYAAGGERRTLFDGVAIHPYADDPSELERNVSVARRVLDQHGDFDTPLDVTEFGWPSLWSSGGLGGVLSPLLPPPPSTTLPYVSDVTRAAYLSEVTDSLASSDCGIERILPHTWVTSQQNRSSAEYWYGIVSPSGGESESAVAYSEAIMALERAATPTHAANALCGRTLSLSVVRSTTHQGPRPSACAGATVSSHGFALDHATVTFTAASARGRATDPRAVTAVTDPHGIAVGCVRTRPREAIVLLVTARRPDFSDTPSKRVRAVGSRYSEK